VQVAARDRLAGGREAEAPGLASEQVGEKLERGERQDRVELHLPQGIADLPGLGENERGQDPQPGYRGEHCAHDLGPR